MYLDIQISKTKPNLIQRFGIWIALSVITISLVVFLWSFGSADFSVKKSSLVFADVSQSDFTVSVKGTGVLAADDIQWLATNVEAKVDKIYAKPGKFVQQGDLIVELSNPQLQQRLVETQWELEAQEAEGVAQKVSQESNLLEQKAALLNARLNYQSTKLKRDAQSELVKQQSGAISQIDYKKTQLETVQLLERWEIHKEQYQKMIENNAAQENARAARINKMRKTLDRVQQQVESLRVTATMDSVVQEVPLEIGQQLPMGSNIAKLARNNSLIAELQIAELHIRDVAIGQRVIVDTRNSKIEGTVSRIDPAVINGNVQVDVIFEKQLPKDARPDLSVDGEIKIAEMKNVLNVSRPIFAQSGSRTAIYKLDQKGQFAERLIVELGRGSLSQIQIIEGLVAGDRIIISDPTGFDSYQKIRIN